MNDPMGNDSKIVASGTETRDHVAWVTEAMEAATTRRERMLIAEIIDDLCRVRNDDAYVVDTLAHLRRLIGRLSVAIFTDPLTGLRNRRGYMVDASQLLELAERTQRTALVFCFELEGLPAINAGFGWASGDAALRRVAHALERTFGPDGVVGRISGNEFAAALITESPNRAPTVLRLVQYRLGAPQSEERQTSPLVSVGLSMYRPGDEQGLGELLAQADRAMCAARRLVARQPEIDGPPAREAVRRAG